LTDGALGDLLDLARQLVVEDEDLAASAAVAHEVGRGIERDPARALTLRERPELLDAERLGRNAGVRAARLEGDLHEKRRRAVSRACVARHHGDDAERDGLDGCAHGSPRHDVHLLPLVWCWRSLSRARIWSSNPKICSARAAACSRE